MPLLQAFEVGVVGSRLRVPNHKDLLGVLFWDVCLKDPHSHTQALAGILTEHLLGQCQMHIAVTFGAVADAVMAKLPSSYPPSPSIGICQAIRPIRMASGIRMIARIPTAIITSGTQIAHL